jgi:hypothetical protein
MPEPVGATPAAGGEEDWACLLLKNYTPGMQELFLQQEKSIVYLRFSQAIPSLSPSRLLAPLLKADCAAA